MSDERAEGRREGVALAILEVAGLVKALHDYAGSIGMTGEELEDLFSGPLGLMFRAVGRRPPTHEEEVARALGGEP